MTDKNNQLTVPSIVTSIGADVSMPLVELDKLRSAVTTYAKRVAELESREKMVLVKVTEYQSQDPSIADPVSHKVHDVQEWRNLEDVMSVLRQDTEKKFAKEMAAVQNAHHRAEKEAIVMRKKLLSTEATLFAEKEEADL